MEMWTRSGGDVGVPADANMGSSDVETTGRLLVLTDISRTQRGKARDESIRRAERELRSRAGLEVMHSKDFGTGMRELTEAIAEVKDEKALMLDDLGVTIAASREDVQSGLASASMDSASAVIHAEPERVVWIVDSYVEGFRAGVNSLAESIDGDLLARRGTDVSALPGGPYADDARSTWGLKAVGAADGRETGESAKVAVLDTGIDATHPDLQDAIEATESFIPGETADDGHGHGTHCCGTVAGRSQGSRAYGVAPRSRLFAGKVLSNAGRGSDSGILAGIQWAIVNGCQVVSMSLGGRTPVGAPHSQLFETVAQRALDAGTIIVCAAGNDSRRPGQVAHLNHPANCPSILAVGALTSSLAPASFSNAGRVGLDHVAIAGPGVDVFSAIPGGGHRTMSGTSMATPHVAGVAAVLHARDGSTGAELAMRLLTQADGLLASSVDVGVGLASVRL